MVLYPRPSFCNLMSHAFASDCFTRSIRVFPKRFLFNDIDYKSIISFRIVSNSGFKETYFSTSSKTIVFPAPGRIPANLSSSIFSYFFSQGQLIFLFLPESDHSYPSSNCRSTLLHRLHRCTCTYIFHLFAGFLHFEERDSYVLVFFHSLCLLSLTQFLKKATIRYA